MIAAAGAETPDGYDPDGGPTEILAEAPLERKDLSMTHPTGEDGSAEPALTLISLNERKVSTATFAAVTLRGGVLRCGRGPENALPIDDPRVSQHHFTIQVRGSMPGKLGYGGSLTGASSNSNAVPPHAPPHPEGPQGLEKTLAPVLELVDESSNGTWVNDTFLGKGASMQLNSGDSVFVLPAARVGPQDMVGFAISLAEPFTKRPPQVPTPCRSRSTTCGKPSNDAEKAQAIVKAQPIVSPRDLNRETARSVHCRICDQTPIHRCVTVIPCGHNFCLACLLAWYRRCQDCPGCEFPIRRIVRNRNVDGIIDTYLQANPAASRPREALAVLDALENDRQNAVLLADLLNGFWFSARAKKSEERPALPLTHISDHRPSEPTRNRDRMGSAACTIC